MAATPGNDPVWESLMYEPFLALTVVGALLLVAGLIAGRSRSDAPAAGGSAGASRSSVA